MREPQSVNLHAIKLIYAKCSWIFFSHVHSVKTILLISIDGRKLMAAKIKSADYMENNEDFHRDSSKS